MHYPGCAYHQTALDYLTDPTAKYVPLAVPEAKMYNGVEADEYVIGLVQYRNYFSSSMPNGALVRGYVQLETPANAGISQHYPLQNELIDGTLVRHWLLRCHAAAIPGTHHCGH